LLRDGVPLDSAVKTVGVTWRDYQNVIRQGESALDDPTQPASGWFVECVLRIREAQGIGVRNTLSYINNAMAQDWHAAAWMLEKQDPEVFAPRSSKNVKMQVDQRSVIEHHTSTVERTESIFRVAEAIEAAHDPVAAQRWSELRKRALPVEKQE
jgi:hypothetical protein